MSVIVKFKRRTSGATGAPAALKAGEAAYNEVDGLFYVGYGDDGAGNATSIKAFAKDNFVDPATLYQPKDNDLTALAALSATAGFLSRTGQDTFAPRTLTGTAARITITNPTGAAGDPTIDLATVAAGTDTTGGFTKQKIDGYGRVIAQSQASLTDLALPTADFSLGGFGLTTLRAPVNPGDAVNKAYVDAIRQGTKYKDPARASAGTANVNVANPGTSTFDTVVLNVGEPLLLYSQTALAENGKYIFNGPAVPLTRADDMDSWSETIGAVVGIAEGSVGIADTARLFTNNAGGTLGTTALTNISFGGGTTGAFTTAGAGLTVPTTGTVAVNPGTGITVAANAVALTGQALALHNVVTAADQVIYSTGVATFATASFTAYGRSLVAAANAAAAQAVLGLGTLATQNANSVAISGGTIDGIILDGGTF